MTKGKNLNSIKRVKFFFFSPKLNLTRISSQVNWSYLLGGCFFVSLSQSFCPEFLEHSFVLFHILSMWSFHLSSRVRGPFKEKARRIVKKLNLWRLKTSKKCWNQGKKGWKNRPATCYCVFNFSRFFSIQSSLL